METVKDFLKEFKDRLTSPLFGSFIISWLVFNWKIPVALIFYKHSELKIDRYKSYFSLIRQEQSTWSMLILPLFFALLYIFGYPWVKNFIKEYQAKLTTTSEAKILKISKDGFVSVAKHMELQEKYEKNIENITTFFNNQDQIQQDNVTLKSELAIAKQENTRLKSGNTSNYSDPFNFVVGAWSFIFRNKEVFIGEREIQFDPQNLQVGNRHGTQDEVAQSITVGYYTVVNYAGDSQRNMISIVAKSDDVLAKPLLMFIDKIEQSKIEGNIGGLITFTATRLT